MVSTVCPARVRPRTAAAAQAWLKLSGHGCASTRRTFIGRGPSSGGETSLERALDRRPFGLGDRVHRGLAGLDGRGVVAQAVIAQDAFELRAEALDRGAA